MKHLAGLTKVRWLNLHYAKVSDQGMKNLAGMVELVSLRFNGTRVTNQG